MLDIGSWLVRLGLAKYADVFAQNEIDLDTVRHLSDDDLKELGLPIGPRRKVMAAVIALSEAGSRADVARSAHTRLRGEAERRQLTIMFVDLVGSTALSQQSDPEEMRDLIAAYQSAVSREIRRFDGHVAKLMGDGVLAYFGWPRAHEDDAERAIRAGLAAISAIVGLKTVRGEPLAARVGIATGLVVVGDLIGEGAAQEELVVGDAPNLAARLQAFAEPNTVVVSGSAQKLVDGLFETADLGHVKLNGFATRVHTYRIVGDAEVLDRFDARRSRSTALVGRGQELDLLLDRWRSARDGQGQVVLLSGEPGIGKSRLIAALADQISAETYTDLRYFCSAYHQHSAFYPVIKQLERATGMHRDDSNDDKLAKLELWLGKADTDPADVSSLLAQLMSIDTSAHYPPLKLTAQGHKVRTEAALIELLAATTVQRPAMIVIEDVHWIDPTTGDWLDALVDRLPGLPVLLVISFRPEFRPRWTGRPHVMELLLRALSRDESAAIIDLIAGGKALPAEVKQRLLSNAEGVPLFVEELTRAVIESGSLDDTGDGHVLAAGAAAAAVPSTLQDSLMARLDRLGRAKEVAQAGACIGRVFHHRLLAEIVDLRGESLQDALEELLSSQLAFRSGAALEAIYTFKHALVQDTAYQSLLKSRRQKLHAAIAGKLEANFPDIVLAEPETLAHHYSAAGMPAPAIAYWLKAGQAAMRRSANIEATTHLTRGIQLIASLPESVECQRLELQFQSALGGSMTSSKGPGAPEVLAAYSRARLLSERLGDKQQQFVALNGEAFCHMFAGDLRAADDVGRRCFELAEADGDESLMLEAYHRQWATKFRMGDFDAAQRYLDLGYRAYDPTRHHSLTYTFTGHDPGTCCRSHLARVLWIRGYPDQAVQCAREGVALGETVSHTFSWLLVHGTLSEIHLLRGEVDEARRCISEWGDVANEVVVPYLQAEARFQSGWALAEERRPQEGIEAMREGMEAHASSGARADLQYYLCTLAEAHGECGRILEGLSLLDEAFRIVNASGSKLHVPELHRIRGKLRSKLDPRDPLVEDCYRKALDLARSERTRSYELRAARSLARRYGAQDRRSEARDVLLPIYEWFTEGHDTRDLVEARALLEQLQ
jgi:class 3 adenylate cyclase/predicted ATPase